VAGGPKPPSHVDARPGPVVSAGPRFRSQFEQTRRWANAALGNRFTARVAPSVSVLFDRFASRKAFHANRTRPSRYVQQFRRWRERQSTVKSRRVRIWRGSVKN